MDLSKHFALTTLWSMKFKSEGQTPYMSFTWFFINKIYGMDWEKVTKTLNDIN